MKERISGVYKIVNTVTGDSYIGSSKDVYSRWAAHKCPSKWKQCPNNEMYQDMQKYGVDKFDFQVLVPVMPEYLTQVEQELIEMLKPTYNSNNAKGLNVERYKEAQKKYQKEYRQTEKYKEAQKKYQKKYQQTEKGKEANRKALKKYRNQLCIYNGETLTLGALLKRFQRMKIPRATVEAKKYLVDTIQQSSEKV